MGEDFVAALQADFAEHGAKVIEAVRIERPDQYLKVIASIVPKELMVKTDPIGDMSDNELESALAFLRALMAAKNGDDGRDETTKH